jgi:hypothetical protein
MGSTPPIPGSLTGFVGQDGIPVAYFTAANVLTNASFTVLEAPSGGTTVLNLNTAADGSGSGITVTIADGDNFATASGTVAIAAGSYIYQRVVSDAGGALALSGEYTVSSTTGVTTLLTSLAAVKLDAKITGTDANRDIVLNSIIAGVSVRMENYMDRSISQATATDEKLDSIGDYKVQTRHYPIISVTSLEEDGTALVEDTGFELNEEDLERGQIIRISGDDPIAWASGRRVVKVTYEHGYAAVPADLVQAATAQSVWEFNQTIQSGKGWRGLGSKGVDPSAAVNYDKDHWLREVVPVLEKYRRQVV